MVLGLLSSFFIFKISRPCLISWSVMKLPPTPCSYVRLTPMAVDVYPIRIAPVFRGYPHPIPLFKGLFSMF